MTPMKCVLLFGTMVLVEDMAGGVELKATCPNERDAEWVAQSLATHHKVEMVNVNEVAGRNTSLVVRLASA